MANQEQLSILKQGVKVWNRWREENPNVEIDLNKSYFNYDNLSEVNLNQADLRGAYFSRANLKKANLSGANLNGVHLEGANLSGADLRRADLRTAWLLKAGLSGANLQGANLSGADLTEVDLTGADLKAARINRATLRNAVLIGANLREADLRGTNLSEADFSSAHLYRADLRNTNFEEARFNVDPRRVALLTDPISSRSSGKYQSPLDIPEPIVDPSEVFFTAMYPKEGRAEVWHTLLVYAHLQSAIDDVLRDGDRFKDLIRAPKKITSVSFTPIVRGAEITIVPSCDGVVFNPERVALKWMENYHRADFRFKAEQSLVNDAARGEINIYVGPVMVGCLKFAMLLNETDLSANEVLSGAMYHQEDVFISYSHKDSQVALACKKAYDALGFNILIDVDTLRSGQVWNEELMRMVDRATIFQLFWSRNSAQSQYCRQEWEHAVKRNKQGFIRPVYWEVPMPKPPDELSEYHFEYLELLPKRRWWSLFFKRGS